MYRDFIRKKMPLVMTQIDRDRHSKTYGCCDRNFWHLKIRDFPSAILQQSGLALAIAYLTDFEGNICYHNENVKEWAAATVRYWCSIQLPDGSFNEYYPWEHGFPPTAFSLYSACEVYKRLELNDADIKKCMEKTARYLSKTIESQAMNQEIASVTALYSAYTVLNKPWILEAVQKKLEIALKTQSSEGWFPEYGGADIGYLSVSLDFLAEYYWMSRDENALEASKRIFSFIKYFIHPDGTCGGEYGSRNTTYFMPNGLEILSVTGDGCAERLIRHLYSHSLEPGFFMDSVDDRYLSHYILHSFLRAEEKRLQNSHPESENAPFEKDHYCVFNNAGLISFRNDTLAGIISTKKGGIIKLFYGDRECFLDCGYRVNYGKGLVAATNWLDPAYKISYGDNSAKISGYMNKVSLKVPSPILHLGLRVISFTFGRRIIGFLKKKIILVDKHSDISFNREITIKKNLIEILDELFSPEAVTIERAGNMSLRHVASGKFFAESDLLILNEETTESVSICSIRRQTRIINENGKLQVTYDRLG